MRKRYEYIQDPGHGWLKVPLEDLPTGFRPSSYSFKNDRFAFLEEDCDFTAFERLVPPFDVRPVYIKDFNRKLERFTQSRSALEAAERAWAKGEGQ